ncbi:MAG: hemolysin III family protein, partial [Pseudomonadota bacterium]|nr:hemolysin III family protein [Pseudomonadota bacterium]
MHHSERFNSYSHLIGLILATAGTAMLITFSALEKGAAAITSSSVYGAMLILLYASSTLYHSATGPIKKTFQKLDHICIYLLIAGTYTPYVLVSLKGGWGWALF